MSDEAFIDIVTLFRPLPGAIIYGAVLVSVNFRMFAPFIPKGIFTKPKNIHTTGEETYSLGFLALRPCPWPRAGGDSDLFPKGAQSHQPGHRGERLKVRSEHYSPLTPGHRTISPMGPAHGKRRKHKKLASWNFRGGPVVTTSPFTSGVSRFNPWSGS